MSRKVHPGVSGASRPLVTALCVPIMVAPSQSMTQGPVARPAGPRRGQEAPGAGRPLFPPAGHTAGAAEASAGRADLTARSGRGLSRGEGRWHHATGQAGSCCESSEPRRTSASPPSLSVPPHARGRLHGEAAHTLTPPPDARNHTAVFGELSACGWTKGWALVSVTSVRPCHLCPHVPPGSTRSGRLRLAPGRVPRASLSHPGASVCCGRRTLPQCTAQGRARRHLLTRFQPPVRPCALGTAVQGPDSNVAVPIRRPPATFALLRPSAPFGSASLGDGTVPRGH